jgi:Flp pilus assembly protein TadG
MNHFRPQSSPQTASRPFRKGGALLEGALTMSLIVGLSFGAVEYGFAFYVKHALQLAAYAGARAAIATGSTNTTVNSQVSNSLAAEGFSSAAFTTTTAPASVSGVNGGTNVTVSVSCTWGAVGVSPLPTSMGGMPSTKQLSCSVVMEHE